MIDPDKIPTIEEIFATISIKQVVGPLVVLELKTRQDDPQLFNLRAGSRLVLRTRVLDTETASLIQRTDKIQEQPKALGISIHDAIETSEKIG